MLKAGRRKQGILVSAISAAVTASTADLAQGEKHMQADRASGNLMLPHRSRRARHRLPYQAQCASLRYAGTGVWQAFLHAPQHCRAYARRQKNKHGRQGMKSKWPDVRLHASSEEKSIGSAQLARWQAHAEAPAVNVAAWGGWRCHPTRLHP